MIIYCCDKIPLYVFMFSWFEKFLPIVKSELRSHLFWIIFLILLGLVFGAVTAYIIEIKEGLII